MLNQWRQMLQHSPRLLCSNMKGSKTGGIVVGKNNIFQANVGILQIYLKSWTEHRQVNTNQIKENNSIVFNGLDDSSSEFAVSRSDIENRYCVTQCCRWIRKVLRNTSLARTLGSSLAGGTVVVSSLWASLLRLQSPFTGSHLERKSWQSSGSVYCGSTFNTQRLQVSASRPVGPLFRQSVVLTSSNPQGFTFWDILNSFSFLSVVFFTYPLLLSIPNKMI